MNFIKKKLKSMAYLLICSFILYGCNNINRTSYDNSTEIDVSSNRIIKIKEHQIILKKIIPLETTKDCTIGIINKIVIRNNGMFIVDFMKATSTFYFDLEGKFVKGISSKGKAEGEYLSNRDFIEKYNRKGFYLFDKKLHKLLEYDTKLIFIKELNIPFAINSLVEIKDGLFLVERSSQNKFFLNLCNSKFAIMKEFIARPKYQLNYDFCNPFPFKVSGKDSLNYSYSPSLSNFIFEYNENNFVKKYSLKDDMGFPNKSFFESNKGVHPGRILQRFQKENYLSFLDFYENDHLLLLKYYRGKDKNFTIYNKITSHTVSYNTSDNTIFSSILNNVLAISQEGNFVSFLFPYQITDIDKNEKSLDNLITKLPKTNQQDNPLIVFFNIQ